MSLHRAPNRRRTASPPPSTPTGFTPAPPLRPGSPRTVVDLRSAPVAACHGSPRGAVGPGLLKRQRQALGSNAQPQGSGSRAPPSGSSSRALPPSHGSPSAAAYLPRLPATVSAAFSQFVYMTFFTTFGLKIQYSSDVRCCLCEPSESCLHETGLTLLQDVVKMQDYLRLYCRIRFSSQQLLTPCIPDVSPLRLLPCLLPVPGVRLNAQEEKIKNDVHFYCCQ